MQFDARLGGEAAALARDHAGMMRRLPATVHAFILVELQKWPTLFPAERRYQRALAEHVGRRRRRPGAAFCRDCQGRGRGGPEQDRRARSRTFSGSRPGGAAEAEASCPRGGGKIDLFFQQIDPLLESRLVSRPIRPAVSSSSCTAATSRCSPKAVVPVQGAGHADSSHARRRQEPRWLSTRALRRRSQDRKESLFGRLQDDAAFAPTDSWIVESHRALHDLLLQTPTEPQAPLARRSAQREGGSPEPRAPNPEPRAPTVSLTGLSYERLLPYRDVLMRALFSKVQTGVESPRPLRRTHAA